MTACKHCGEDLNEDQIKIARTTNTQSGLLHFHTQCFQELSGPDFIPELTEGPIESVVKNCIGIKKTWWGKKIEVTQHEWGKMTEKQNFRDTNAPYQTRTCKVCGKYEIIRVTYRDSK